MPLMKMHQMYQLVWLMWLNQLRAGPAQYSGFKSQILYYLLHMMRAFELVYLITLCLPPFFSAKKSKRANARRKFSQTLDCRLCLMAEDMESHPFYSREARSYVSVKPSIRQHQLSLFVFLRDVKHADIYINNIMPRQHFSRVYMHDNICTLLLWLSRVANLEAINKAFMMCCCASIMWCRKSDKEGKGGFLLSNYCLGIVQALSMYNLCISRCRIIST